MGRRCADQRDRHPCLLNRLRPDLLVAAARVLTRTGVDRIAPPSFQKLQSDLKQGKLVTFDTPDKDNLPYNLVGHHSYMVVGVTTDSCGKQYVELRKADRRRRRATSFITTVSPIPTSTRTD